MTRPAAPHIQLNRAYVQSKVIEANLQHLGATIVLADGSLHDDVHLFTQRFEEFVRRLSHILRPARPSQIGDQHDFFIGIHRA